MAVMMDTDQENRRSTRQRRPPTHLQQYNVESVGFGKPQEPCTTNPRPSATHLKPGGRGITNPAPAQQQSDLKELQDEVCSLKETIKLLVDRMGSLHICNRDSESVNVSEDCISSDDDFDVDYSQPAQRPHSCVEFQCSIPEENRVRSSCSAPSRLAFPHPASQSSSVQPQPLIAPQSSVVPTHNPQPRPQPLQPYPAFPSSSLQPQVSSQSGVLPPHIPQSSSQPPQPQPAFPSSSVQPQVSSQSAVFPPHIPQSSSQPSSQPPQHYPASPSSSLQSQPQPHTAFQSGFLLPCNLQSNFQPAQSYPAPQFDLPTPADSQSNPLPPLALQPGLLVQPAPQPIPSVQPAPVSNLYVPPLPGLQLPTAPVHSFYAPQAHYTNSPSQTPVTSHYSSRIVTPSFPDFRSDDPYEFIMLKMALDNLVPPYESEMFKYHVLLDHLLLPSARYIALSYAHDPQPYTKSVAALEQQYGQPHHLALREISSILQLPRIRPGDSKGFHAFALRVQSLVGMLQSLGPGAGTAELSCSSHVQQLLSKLPTDQIANYARYAQLHHPHVQYNLMHFSAWLQGEAQCQALASGVLGPHLGVLHEANRKTDDLVPQHSSSKVLYLNPSSYSPKVLLKMVKVILSYKDFDNAMPMLLIGADNTYLITAIEEVRAGPPGTPVAIHTRLGWTLQGPTYLHKTDSAQLLLGGLQQSC
ncbi:BRD4-interacting chromatin-remodeling complex-associated protein-like [Astyanax mexicanus]|uniref:BRD4-interacting chromatin-remodeling complex-associated protein-like n=1 Tax=Astyanax mexicanus TaxID=7994 RepID=UPI0020CAE4A7|nr:BRD4-interacting chromatin-remodeling complex-associated protein-like [Astyanax mexicanus]